MVNEQFVIVAFTLFFPPLLFLVGLVVILATFGKSLGIRRKYVQVLIQIFEWAALLAKAKTAAEEESRKNDEHNIDNDDEGLVMLTKGDAEHDADGDGREAASADDISSVANDQKPADGTSSSASSFVLTNFDVQSEFIEPEANQRISALLREGQAPPPEDKKAWALTNDSLDFIKAGIESIIDDEVTKRFSAEQLASWNMLSRTSGGIQFVSWELTVVWILGFIWRYFLLFPARMLLLGVGLIVLVISTTIVGYCPDGNFKRWLNRHANLVSYRILCRSVSAIITYHHAENQAQRNGICVANHTSPIDVVILSNDNCYALVGQSHGGLLGLVQRALSRASSHIWFERSVASDRTAVARRLRKHVEDPNKLPILIFPEGTCINNTSVMMFKKGSFEVGGVIYPAAVKYDPRFGDPFWNSSEQSMMEYLFMMMTSWAIVCDVWYLPPMTRREGEDAIEFANRVKRAIAKAGGLVDLEWDGGLKRKTVSGRAKDDRRTAYAKVIMGSQHQISLSANDVCPPEDPQQSPRGVGDHVSKTSPANFNLSAGESDSLSTGEPCTTNGGEVDRRRKSSSDDLSVDFVIPRRQQEEKADQVDDASTRIPAENDAADNSSFPTATKMNADLHRRKNVVPGPTKNGKVNNNQSLSSSSIPVVDDETKPPPRDNQQSIVTTAAAGSGGAGDRTTFTTTTDDEDNRSSSTSSNGGGRKSNGVSSRLLDSPSSHTSTTGAAANENDPPNVTNVDNIGHHEKVL